MSEFEFVLIPVGIVIGLAIAMILQSWGAVINQPFRESRPGFFFSATGLVLASVVANFGGLWSYREVVFAVPEGPVVFVMPLLLILPVLFMFLALAIVIPSREEPSRDFDLHYFSVSRRFFVVFGIAWLGGSIIDLIPGVGWTLELAEYAIVPLFCLVLAVTKLRAVHAIGHVLFWLFFVGGFTYSYIEYLNYLKVS